MRKRNGGSGQQFSSDPLDDYPVDPERGDQDLEPAQKAVAVHQPEQWPSGRYCRNDHSRWPCRLYRWGHQVLWLAGWREAEFVELLLRAESGDVPWS